MAAQQRGRGNNPEENNERGNRREGRRGDRRERRTEEKSAFLERVVDRINQHHHLTSDLGCEQLGRDVGLHVHQAAATLFAPRKSVRWYKTSSATTCVTCAPARLKRCA